jgi:hypothetical protein
LTSLDLVIDEPLMKRSQSYGRRSTYQPSMLQPQQQQQPDIDCEVISRE